MTSTNKGLIGKDSNGKCVLKYQNGCTYKYLTGEHERTSELRGNRLTRRDRLKNDRWLYISLTILKISLLIIMIR